MWKRAVVSLWGVALISVGVWGCTDSPSENADGSRGADGRGLDTEADSAVRNDLVGAIRAGGDDAPSPPLDATSGPEVSTGGAGGGGMDAESDSAVRNDSVGALFDSGDDASSPPLDASSSPDLGTSGADGRGLDTEADSAMKNDSAAAIRDGGDDASSPPLDGPAGLDLGTGISLVQDICGSLPSGAVSSPTQLLDLGHGSEISFLRQSGTLVLSRDSDHHWVLWDTTTRGRIAIGDSPYNSDTSKIGFLDLRTDTLAVEVSFGTVELRNASTGALTATVAFGSGAVGLAADGSYLWASSEARVTAWSMTGAVLVSHDGDYNLAKVFAAPNELRIALGPSGASVIEVISTSTGKATTTPSFSGTFHSWFLDGESFLTYTGLTVWVYPKSSGAATGIFPLPTIENLTGQGAFFWTYEASTTGYPLDVYSVASTTNPVLSLNGDVDGQAVGSADMIGLLSYGDGGARIVHLDSAIPTVTSHSVPAPQYLRAFAATTGGRWSVGNMIGVVYDSENLAAARSLGCGNVWSIAGASNGNVALATASGGIIVVNVTSAASSVARPIPFVSTHVEISAAGDILGASATAAADLYSPESTLKFFALPSGLETKTWLYDSSLYDDFTLLDFSLAQGGQRIGQVTGTFNFQSWLYKRTVTDLDGTIVEFSDTTSVDTGNLGPMRINLSPDGTMMALADGGPGWAVSTRIYRNGTLINAFSGYPIGWLDDNRLLLRVYVAANHGIDSAYSNSVIRDSSGGLLATLALPELSRATLVSGNQIYSPDRNAIFDLVTGALVWGSTVPGFTVGAAAGRSIVSRDRYQVLVESF